MSRQLTKKRWVVLAVVFLSACGGDNNTPTEDVGTDAHDSGLDAGLDSGGTSDMPIVDVAQPDQGSPPDLGPDLDVSDVGPVDMPADQGPFCGNDVVEGEEECDGEAVPATCADQGFTSGTPRCDDICALDWDSCALCGDDVCHYSETATQCPQDCAIVDLDAATFHTCVVRVDGSVACWGARSGHRAGGLGDVGSPVTITGITDAVAVTTGVAHTCVLLGSGEVRCWGRNGYGELGTGDRSREESTPQTVSGLPAAAVSIDAGEHHTCALLDNDSVYCWGRGDSGAIGDSSFRHYNATPQRVTLVGTPSFITAGAQHTCVVNSAGGVACSGLNDQGQLGIGSTQWKDSPSQNAVSKAIDVGAGYRHTCAYVLNIAAPPSLSGLFCWGSNSYGQLGSAPSPDVLSPQRIVAGVRAIEGGGTFTCGIQAAPGDPGPVVCWGRNDFGQLGDGTTTTRFAAGPVTGVTNAVKVAAGSDHICALLQDATVQCWGQNRDGQVGSGSTDVLHTTPVMPEGL